MTVLSWKGTKPTYFQVQEFLQPFRSGDSFSGHLCLNLTLFFFFPVLGTGPTAIKVLGSTFLCATPQPRVSLSAENNSLFNLELFLSYNRDPYAFVLRLLNHREFVGTAVFVSTAEMQRFKAVPKDGGDDDSSSLEKMLEALGTLPSGKVYGVRNISVQMSHPRKERGYKTPRNQRT